MSNKTRLHKIASDTVKKQKLEYTSPEVKRNITEYGVNVNEVLINNHMHWVFDNDVVNLTHWPERPKGDLNSIKIIFQNNDFLVIDKPTNAVSEPGAGHLLDNVLSYLSVTLGQELFSVHRLDKNTSGYMIIAKSPESKQYLQDQFRSKKVTKEYLTTVSGKLEDSVEVGNYQARDKANLLRQKFFWHSFEANKYDPKARYSKSLFSPIAYNQEANITLVKVKIFTGRMHQIRLQAESIGFPLVADPVYNQDQLPAFNPGHGPNYELIKRKTIHNNEYRKVARAEAPIQEKLTEDGLYNTFVPIHNINAISTHELQTNFKIEPDQYYLRAVSLSFDGADGVSYSFVDPILEKLSEG